MEPDFQPIAEETRRLSRRLTTDGQHIHRQTIEAASELWKTIDLLCAEAMRVEVPCLPPDFPQPLMDRFPAIAALRIACSRIGFEGLSHPQQMAILGGGGHREHPDPLPSPEHLLTLADELASPGEADKGADDDSPASNAEQPSLEARALALLVDHPEWTDTRIAKTLKCSRGSLYRWEKFKAAREQMKGDGMASQPRGSKADGRIEAWETER